VLESIFAVILLFFRISPVPLIRKADEMELVTLQAGSRDSVLA